MRRSTRTKRAPRRFCFDEYNASNEQDLADDQWASDVENDDFVSGDDEGYQSDDGFVVPDDIVETGDEGDTDGEPVDEDMQDTDDEDDQEQTRAAMEAENATLQAVEKQMHSIELVAPIDLSGVTQPLDRTNPPPKAILRSTAIAHGLSTNGSKDALLARINGFIKKRQLHY